MSVYLKIEAENLETLTAYLETGQIVDDLSGQIPTRVGGSTAHGGGLSWRLSADKAWCTQCRLEIYLNNPEDLSEPWKHFDTDNVDCATTSAAPNWERV